MQWWEYEALIQGRGCPCCEGVRPIDFQSTDVEQFDDRWARALMDATDEVEPWQGFLQDPLQYASLPWPTRAPTWRERAPGLAEQLEGFSTIAEVTGDLQLGGRKDVTSIVVYVGCNDADLVTDLSDADDSSDVLRIANGRVIEQLLREVNATFKPRREGGVTVKVAELEVGPEGVSVIHRSIEAAREIERRLAEYPILDDELYGELENERLVQLIDEDVRSGSMQALIEALGLTDGPLGYDIVDLIVHKNRDELYEVDGLSFRYLGDEKAWRVFVQYLGLPGYTVLQSTANRDAYLLVSDIDMEVLSSVEGSDKVRGVLLRRDPRIVTLPVAEFMVEATSYPRLSTIAPVKLEGEALGGLIRFLMEPEDVTVDP